MGKPRLPRGIQVTYADVSVAVETVGLSGASGAEEKQGRVSNGSHKHGQYTQTSERKFSNDHVQHLLGAHPSGNRNAKESETC